MPRKLRNFKFFFSVIFSLILCGLGFATGVALRNAAAILPHTTFNDAFNDLLKDTAFFSLTIAAFGLIGLLLGSITGPKVGQGLINLGNSIERSSTRDKIAAIIGVLFGAVCTLPFILLATRWPLVGIPLAILFGFAFAYLGVRGAMSMKEEIRFVGGGPKGPDGEEVTMERCKILDTNVIIDGRIIDITKSGFLDGTIYVPGFVLEELQHIADSADALKRARGRRGLDILNAMQKETPLVVRSFDHKLTGANNDEVDTRLVKLAKVLGGSIVTNDFNLNKVASLQGVQVLNVNELANALKPVVLPGEEMQVLVIREGKEHNQGVAYLDDGTMIVVEDGRKHIGEAVCVSVSSVLQTVAGKMIFAKMRDSESSADEDGHDGNRYRAGSGPRPKVR
jgi:uncharacterized protein YacL